MRLSARFGLLRDHGYRQLFASTTVSQFGFHVTRLAIPLVAIVALDATAFQIGVLAALTTAPFLLIGLPAGAWVDRWRRRTVLIIGDVGRGIVLASVPIAWWADLLTLAQLYAVAFVLGIFTVFFDVAYQSYLPHLVGRPNLPEGNAKLEAMRATAELTGPAIAGQLIRLLSLPVALLITAVTTAASAIFVARIGKREERPVRRPDAHLLREIAEGLRFVLGHRLLRAIAACTASFNLLATAYGAMLILYLERSLGLGPGLIGLALTGFGIGALIGSFAARRIAGRLGQGPAIWLSVALTSPFMLLMPLAAAPDWRLAVAVAGSAVSGIGVVVYNVTQVSFRQAVTPDRLLGRMNATMRFLVFGTMPLGGLLGGVLGELLGVRTTLLVLATGMCFAFLPVFLSPLRTLRELPVGDPDPPAAPTQPAPTRPAPAAPDPVERA